MTASPRAGTFRAVLRKVLVGAFLLGAGYAVFRVLSGHGEEIGGLLAEPDAKWLLGLALAAGLAQQSLGVQTWRRVLSSLGSPVDFPDGARICFAAVLGTYLPGPWWQPLAAAHIGRRTGIATRRMVTAYVLVAVVNVLSAAAVGLLAAPLVLGANWGWLAVPLLLGGFLLWRPESVLRLAERATRLLRRDPIAEQADPGGLRHAMFFQLAAWAIGGLNLWLIALALGAPLAETLSIAVGAYAFGSAAGALALVLPAGAGVRELVIIAALSSVLPVSAATVAAIGSRVCLIAAESLFGGGLVVTSWLGRSRKRPSLSRPG